MSLVSAPKVSNKMFADTNCSLCAFKAENHLESANAQDIRLISNWIYNSHDIQEDYRYEVSKIFVLRQPAPELNSCLVVGHGTKFENVASIIKHGFQLERSENKLYGKGTYYSDSFFKTTLYSGNAYNRNLCEACQLVNCCFLCYIPTEELEKSSEESKIISEYKDLNNKELVADEFGRNWHFLDESSEIDQLKLYGDDLFNEFVIAGEQLVPMYLILTIKCDKQN